ncbi:flagellar biosynthetic protein FliR [Trichococcus palustris]|nr:flagellar biosynthetic protein FliR [Trichococcus palustris]
MMSLTLPKIFLIFIRISSFIIISPGFSFKGMPNLAKIALSLGLSIPVYIITPAMNVEFPIFYFILLGIKELVVGMAIGYISQLFFSAVEMAGSFADFQVGFSMASVFDPAIGVQASYFGRVYYWLSMCIFFFTDMHHQVLKALVQSFVYFPIERLSVGTFGVEGILKLFSMVFEIALNLAAPIMIAALLTEIVLGVLSRTVPQINVLILSMPLKILVSLGLMLVLLPKLANNLEGILPLIVKYMNEFVQALAAG